MRSGFGITADDFLIPAHEIRRTLHPRYGGGNTRNGANLFRHAGVDPATKNHTLSGQVARLTDLQVSAGRKISEQIIESTLNG